MDGTAIFAEKIAKIAITINGGIMFGRTSLLFAKIINDESIKDINANGVSAAKTRNTKANEKKNANWRERYHKKRGNEKGVCKFCGDPVYYSSRAGRMPVACIKIECKQKARTMGRTKREPIENFKGE